MSDFSRIADLAGGNKLAGAVLSALLLMAVWVYGSQEKQDTDIAGNGARLSSVETTSSANTVRIRQIEASGTIPFQKLLAALAEREKSDKEWREEIKRQLERIENKVDRR